MEDEEIISIRAENEKYIQEAAFYKTKTMYINLKNKKIEQIVILNGRFSIRLMSQVSFSYQTPLSKDSTMSCLKYSRITRMLQLSSPKPTCQWMSLTMNLSITLN